ncbi:ABC transporter ATP-binding protein [Qipengyuania sp.]|uniref:ABC transporter ATP-binding protein n=1 Tax=Qipengyuania sp. TaxID=2004515 RepID=UPI0037367F46
MILEAQDVSLECRLHEVSLTLRQGEIAAICGPNGAGKSTLLECLAGLIMPDSGAVALNGVGLDEIPPRERARRIGYLPQDGAIAWDIPVRRLVELGRVPHGDRAQGPVDDALGILGLDHLADRRAQSLSGGERARVLLARVLAGEPDWVLADEPLAALDLAHQLALMRHLRKAADRGAGVAMVVHDLALARNHADRVILLSGGRIAAAGPPSEALAKQRIAAVFGVECRWIGAPGALALSPCPTSPLRV